MASSSSKLSCPLRLRAGFLPNAVLAACILLAMLTFAAGAEAFADEQGAFGLGLAEFHRANRGSFEPLPDGADVGYRYITGDSQNVVLIATAQMAVIYVPETVQRTAGIDASDAQWAERLADAFRRQDAVQAHGGKTLEALEVPIVVADDAEYRAAGMTFRFGLQAGGRTYAAVQAAATDASRALFCDYGALELGDGDAVAEPGVQRETDSGGVVEFLAQADYSPLRVSVCTALAATFAVVVVGMLFAWFSLRLGARAKSVLDVAFLIPMVLPPTASGLVLVYVFGLASPTGRWLMSMGLNVPFTWPAAVIAAAVVAMPFMYQAARGAFETLDPDLQDAARTLGWSEARIFMRLMVPLAAPSLAAGAALSFSRALGEFGATVFFAGNYVGVTQTIPLAIYYDWMAGDAAAAWLWVVVEIGFMFAFLLLTNRVSRPRGFGATRALKGEWKWRALRRKRRS